MAEEQHDDGYYEDYAEPQGSSLPGWLTETPYWAISAVIHLILILVIGTIVISRVEIEEKAKKMIVRREQKPREYDPTKKRAMKRRPQILDDIKKKPILKLKPDIITPTKPKGTDMNNLTNKNLMRDSVNDAFGTGGGFAGAYGNRFGKGSLTNEGGSEATEEAVLAALKWLERHQHPDGHWSSSDFFKGKCQDPAVYNDDRIGFEGYDVGVTGLAMLAYLGYGHTHRDGEFPEFREVMRKAMGWMLKQQSTSETPAEDGIYGKAEVEAWVYNHSIASMAMAELLFISRDKFKLQKSVERATDWILQAQNENYGWKYEFRGGKNDTSVTGWMVLALKTAKGCSEARLLKKIKPDDYKKHFEWALNWFGRATSSSNGKTGYEAPGDKGSQMRGVYPDPYPFSKKLSCMTAVAVLCRLFAGESRRSDAIVKDGVKILMDQPPAWKLQKDKILSTINIYYWYYGSYAMFQFGGPKWREWNDAMQEALLPTQRVGTDADGSWDPIGEWGGGGGRVYSTAIGAMTLEVYYRFERQNAGG